MDFLKRISLMVVSMFLIVSLNAYANPNGATVVSGNATITINGKTYTVATSNNAIINYNYFGNAKDEAIVFVQPSANSAVLNRVLGINPSDIEGSLSSNGRIFLVNPNGIIFGPSSVVNAPAIVASTLDISNNDFLNGNYVFSKTGSGSYIINQGQLAASPGGYIALLSQSVNNSGTIIANLGSVVLASGEKMTLSLDSQNQISVLVDDAVKTQVFGPNGQRINSAVQNSGTITANGGKIVLTASVLNNILDFAVNNSGVIEANSMQEQNGVVEFTGYGASSVNAGTINANQVSIATDSPFYGTGSIQVQSAYNFSDSNPFIYTTGSIDSSEVGGLVGITGIIGTNFPILSGLTGGTIMLNPTGSGTGSFPLSGSGALLTNTVNLTGPSPIVYKLDSSKILKNLNGHLGPNNYPYGLPPNNGSAGPGLPYFYHPVKDDIDYSSATSSATSSPQLSSGVFSFIDARENRRKE